jgi:hypothetical protein
VNGERYFICEEAPDEFRYPADIFRRFDFRRFDFARVANGAAAQFQAFLDAGTYRTYCYGRHRILSGWLTARKYYTARSREP